MKKNFLFIYGSPATGKITVARILQKKLGWKLLWFHDIKNAVYEIVKVHRIPELMNEVTEPIIKFLLAGNDDIIYVRPAGNAETINRVKKIVELSSDYNFTLVRLDASYETLLSRVSARKDEYRICSKEDLDKYLADKGGTPKPFPGEFIVSTDDKTPEQVTAEILALLK